MKFLIKIKYLGTDFCGFQVQKGQRTVQGELTEIFSEFFSQKTAITGCSRTDSGVHANEFCITAEPECFDSVTIAAEKIPFAIAHLLPKDISVYEASVVDDDFHPRYNVKGKEYLYRIYTEPCENPFFFGRLMHARPEISDEQVILMQRAADFIVGTHDFTAFMAQGSKIVDAVRTVHYLTVEKRNGIIEIKIHADGFLYNMVRIIVGTLLDVAYGRKKAEDLPKIIESKKRENAGSTAPSCGLYLNRVDY